MCIGITVLTMPPTVAALGYLSWFQGQELYSSGFLHLPSPPPTGWTSTFLAMSSVPLIYYGQAKAFFPLLESQADKQELEKHALKPKPHHLTKITTQAQTGYVPPESITELMYKVGPPLMIRIAATSVAFFAAGAVQSQVAYWMNGGSSNVTKRSKQ